MPVNVPLRARERPRSTSHPAGVRRLPDVGTQPPFEQVVNEHGPTVLRVCRAVLGPADAEEAWSETFLAALEAYPGLRDGSNVRAWLVTIAHRKAIDIVRAQARHAVPTASVPDRSPRPSLPETWETDLWDALKALPHKQRHSLAYHHLAGMPYAEVAVVVGGTAAAARKAASDGIASLRRTYAKGEQR